MIKQAKNGGAKEDFFTSTGLQNSLRVRFLKIIFGVANQKGLRTPD